MDWLADTENGLTVAATENGSTVAAIENEWTVAATENGLTVAASTQASATPTEQNFFANLHARHQANDTNADVVVELKKYLTDSSPDLSLPVIPSHQSMYS